MSQQQWVEEALGNWSDVGTEFTPPAVSIYRGRVTAAAPSPTKAGRPQISVEIELDFDLAASAKATGTLKFQRVLVTTGAGGFRMKQLCESADIDPPKTSKLDDVKDFCDELLGQTVHLRSNLTPKHGDPTTVYAGVARYLTEDQANEAASAFSE